MGEQAQLYPNKDPVNIAKVVTGILEFHINLVGK